MWGHKDKISREVLPRSDGHPTFMADEDKRNSQTSFSPHPDAFKPLYPTHTQLCSKKRQSRIPSLSAKHDSSVSSALQRQWGRFRVWCISIKQSIKKTRELMWVTAYLISCVLAHWEKRIGEIPWQHHSTKLTAQEDTQFHCKKAASPAEPTRCPWTFTTCSWLGFLLNQPEMKSNDFFKKHLLFTLPPTCSLNCGCLPSSPFLSIQVLFNCLQKGPNSSLDTGTSVNFRQGEVYQSLHWSTCDKSPGVLGGWGWRKLNIWRHHLQFQFTHKLLAHVHL